LSSPTPSPTPTVTQSQVQAALRSFLLTVLPLGWEVVQGQDNRVPEPQDRDFVIMTVISRRRLETNGYVYYPPPGTQVVSGAEAVTQAFEVTFQLDFHSANVGDSSDAVLAVSTLFRDDIAYQAFAASGLSISPLYADDPKQVPFINAEQQYETRWVLDTVLQVNAGVVWAQDFMLGAPSVTIYPSPDA
jgi:hypothetical protein